MLVGESLQCGGHDVLCWGICSDRVVCTGVTLTVPGTLAYQILQLSHQCASIPFVLITKMANTILTTGQHLNTCPYIHVFEQCPS